METTTYDQVHAEAMADYDPTDTYADLDYEAARDDARAETPLADSGVYGYDLEPF